MIYLSDRKSPFTAYLSSNFIIFNSFHTKKASPVQFSSNSTRNAYLFSLITNTASSHPSYACFEGRIVISVIATLSGCEIANRTVFATASGVIATL